MGVAVLPTRLGTLVLTSFSVGRERLGVVGTFTLEVPLDSVPWTTLGESRVETLCTGLDECTLLDILGSTS